MWKLRPTQKKTRYGTLYLGVCSICREICYFQRGITICQDCGQGAAEARESRARQAELSRLGMRREIFAPETAQ